ncbi:MAG TPA: diacylglycerol kinase family protein [Gemmatimonadales bacterium]|nr:diacylglycerol kinase family protein [Gemmatimonadales bacterium]
MTRALLITNPFAARADARAVTAILEILGRGGWNVDLKTISGPGDARRIAEESLGAGFDVLVSHGGDGTAMQVAAGIAGSGIALGVVPGGTGNVLAGNLRLPRTARGTARALLRARAHAIDLGIVQRADGAHYFAVGAGTGFDAALMAATGPREKRRWKLGAYVARAALTLPSVRSVPHRVTVDDTRHDIRAAMLLVLNCGKLPPGFLNLRPDLAPDDGWLDVVALEADGAIQSASALLELLFSNGKGKGRRVWWARGRAVRVEVPEGAQRPVQLDGEVTGETPFEARLLPGALSVLVGPAFKAHHG